MTPYRTLATGQQLLSLALAALVTTGVLASLDAQAGGQAADAAQMAQMAQVQGTACQQAGLLAQRPARS